MLLNLFIQMLICILYFIVIQRITFLVCFFLVLYILGYKIESVTLVSFLEKFAFTSANLTYSLTLDFLFCLSFGIRVK